MEDQDLKNSMNRLDVATTKAGTNLTTASTALDGASTRVAAVMAKLSTRMTDEEVAAARQVLDQETDKIDTIAAGLEATANSLNGMAVDASNPVPTPVPEPTPV